MSNAFDTLPEDQQSLACALASDLLFALGFGVLTVVSAMSMPSLPSPAQPLVLFGLVFILGGGVMRIAAGQSLPVLGGERV